MLKVVKFGGSSVAGPEQFKKVKNIIESDESRRIVVISAAGKRNSGDHKLTDLLYLSHAHLTYGVPCDDIIASIEERFRSIRDELGIAYDVGEELRAFKKRMNKDLPVDELVSRGEYFTSRLMADYLGYRFIDAADCVFFTLDGRLNREKTDAAIAAAVEAYGKIVIPGFYGSLPSGKIKVMSRGGSDITGALAAAAAKADVYENWTDVSGILMADPRIVPNPKSISSVTYAELRELAYMGASVLHEESVLPVKEYGIPLNIRNTNAPEDPGTMIVDRIDSDAENADRFITGIAGRRNFSILTVRSRNMNTTGVLCSALAVIDRLRLTAEHITLGLDTFALVVSSDALGDKQYEVIADLEKECKPDTISIEENIALVAIVGRKMTSRPGTSGKVFRKLGEHGVNIRTIAQGADELSIIVGVENSKFEETIRILYDSFA